MSFDSKNTMLVYLGANANKELMHDILGMDPKAGFLTSQIFPEMPKDIENDSSFRSAIVPIDSDIKVVGNELRFTDLCGFNWLPIIEEIMNDKNISLLWSRFNRGIRASNQSEIKRYEVIYSLIKCALKTCDSLNPRLVIFNYEPHMLPLYIFKKVVVALGIKSYTLTMSPFVWRLFCEEDNNPTPLLEHHTKTLYGDFGQESVEKMIAEKQDGYDTAKPFYEKRKLKRGLGTYINKLRNNGWNPKRVIRCYQANRQLKSLFSDRSELQKLKYVSFFLQYQPEQTTLPDGGLFVNQLCAIQMLYSAVSPLGISLVVREHPATFESVFDSKWRSTTFYDTIKNMGSNIYFDDITLDPFSLLENSVAVASITGTILLEGLLRGKPAIAFGKSTLRTFSDSAFIENFTDEDDLRDKVLIASNLPSKSICEGVTSYLHSVYPKTFGDTQYVGNCHMSVERLKIARYSALLQVIDVLSLGRSSSEELCSNKLWSPL